MSYLYVFDNNAYWIESGGNAVPLVQFHSRSGTGAATMPCQPQVTRVSPLSFLDFLVLQGFPVSVLTSPRLFQIIWVGCIESWHTDVSRFHPGPRRTHTICNNVGVEFTPGVHCDLIISHSAGYSPSSIRYFPTGKWSQNWLVRYWCQFVGMNVWG